MIKIEVYDNEDLKTIVRISGEGDVVVPLLGKVVVASLTTTQISDKLSQLFADGYLVNPQVNVFINEYREQLVTILGQVNKPGSYQLKGPITFLQLLSKAGGLTPDAGDKVTVKRTINTSGITTDTTLYIDLDSLIEKGDTAQNISVMDGDSISVNKAGFFYVTGEVKQPASFKFSKKDFPIVIKAITLAGGFTSKANQDAIEIHRVVDGQKEILTAAKLDTIIKVDDVILVPNVFTEDFTGQKANILGQVNKPGNYELRGPTTLLEFISKAGGLTKDASDVAIIKRVPQDNSSQELQQILVDLNALIEEGDVSHNTAILDKDSVYIDKAGRYYVTGEVKRPASFKFMKKDVLNVIKSITLAGGFTPQANQDAIEIHRIVDGQKKVLKPVELNTAIKIDDVILVPNVFIEDFTGQKANILGQVNKPGNYELRGPTTLLEFISKAGGLTKDASDVAIIKRVPKDTSSHELQQILVDLNALIEEGNVSQNIAILDKDSVYINKAGRYYVTGEVKKPASFKFMKKDVLNVIKSITLAGGFTPKANQDAIEIHRMVDGQKIIITPVELGTTIEDDDVILVPNVFTEDFTGHKANILGQVNKPGNYELRGPTTLLEFISKAEGLTKDAGDVAIIKRKFGDSKSHEIRQILVDLNALIEEGDVSHNVPILDKDSVYINKVGHYYVNGEVKKPDAYKYKKETFLNVIKVISLAGGFTGKADRDGIKIYRVINKKEVILEDVKMAEPVLENDVVVVPESFF